MAKFRIPYESLDPLTIGSAGDESKVYREELELEIADANLLAAVYPGGRLRRPGQPARGRGPDCRPKLTGAQRRVPGREGSRGSRSLRRCPEYVKRRLGPGVP